MPIVRVLDREGQANMLEASAWNFLQQKVNRNRFLPSHHQLWTLPQANTCYHAQGVMCKGTVRVRMSVCGEAPRTRIRLSKLGVG